MSEPPPAGHDRTVFFVSDGTGITAETLGHSVLTQFEHLRYQPQRLPFVDTADKARDACARINEAGARDGKRPIVFSTLVDPAVAATLRSDHGCSCDLFETFVEPLERELGIAVDAHHRALTRDPRRIPRTTRTASRRSTSPWRTTTASRPRAWRAPTSSWSASRAPARRRPACTWRCSTASRRPTIR